MNTFAQSDRAVWSFNQKLSPGINISGLEAPVEGDWGPPVSQDEVNRVAKAGFKSIRLPVNWASHASKESPFIIDSLFFKRIDTVLAWASRAQMRVILNHHRFKEVYTQKHRFGEVIKHWEQIALHYKNKVPDVAFEILNEPSDSLTCTEWNKLYPLAIHAIRKIDKKRILILGSCQWNALEALDSLIIPNDSFLMASFHYYRPFQFTHQNAPWLKNTLKYKGTTWGGLTDRMKIKWDFYKAKKWIEKNKVPLNLGEFGVIRDGPAAEDRVKWIQTVVNEARDGGVSYHYWELNYFFGIYTRKDKKFDPLVLDVLVNGL